jgi:hypothetical protein
MIFEANGVGPVGNDLVETGALKLSTQTEAVVLRAKSAHSALAKRRQNKRIRIELRTAEYY